MSEMISKLKARLEQLQLIVAQQAKNVVETNEIAVMTDFVEDEEDHQDHLYFKSVTTTTTTTNDNDVNTRSVVSSEVSSISDKEMIAKLTEMIDTLKTRLVELEEIVKIRKISVTDIEYNQLYHRVESQLDEISTMESEIIRCEENCTTMRSTIIKLESELDSFKSKMKKEKRHTTSLSHLTPPDSPKASTDFQLEDGLEDVVVFSDVFINTATKSTFNEFGADIVSTPKRRGSIRENVFMLKSEVESEHQRATELQKQVEELRNEKLNMEQQFRFLTRRLEAYHTRKGKKIFGKL